MRKSTVRFGHLVHILFLADGVAFVVLGGNEFRGETFRHVRFRTVAGGIEQPAEREIISYDLW